MAVDHFTTHAYHEGRADWNFNIVFRDIPEVGTLAEHYAPTLDRPGLYPPVPQQWLHLTVLRAGFTTEFTQVEMDAVAARLAPALGALRLPECTVGPAWMFRGYPLLHVTPEEPLNEVFQAVKASLRAVVGEKRMPHAIDRSDDKLMPHIALAYPQDSDESADAALGKALAHIDANPVHVRLPSLALIRQWPTGRHYEWDVVHTIPIGQQE